MKLFYVPIEKQIIDIHTLVKSISESGWMDESTVIVTCSPDYSSIDTQILSHKLSHLIKNELFEQAFLEMPYPNMNQVFNIEKDEYQRFDTYLYEWAKKTLKPGLKYLFHDSGVIRGTNFSKVKLIMKMFKEEADLKFSTLYLAKGSKFMPDYYVEVYDDEKSELVFSWENSNNPNWK